VQFAGVNYLAVLEATLASFVFGAVWYGALGKYWMAAAGISGEDIQGRSALVPMAITLVAQLLMAYVLAGAIGHLGPGNVTLRNGVISGLFIWAGFVATSLTVNYTFQMRSRRLLAIDLGHWLGVLVLQGAIIGAAGT
jgi:hypothetical protein